MNKPILCLDFDGVCHSYTSGWKGATVIPDDAVPGLFEFLEAAAPVFDIQVFSTRSNESGGADAMAFWFAEQRKKWRAAGGQGKEILQITFPDKKPPAFVALDDRVVTFMGEWPSVELLREFKPWNKIEPTPKPKQNISADKLSASEALFGFAAWLTSLEAPVTFSRYHNAGTAAELVDMFCKANNLTMPRDGWHHQLIHPTQPTPAQAEGTLAQSPNDPVTK